MKLDEFIQYSNRIGNRVGLYRSVATRFGIKSAVYPGSHIDIYPSLVIPQVTYIDSFKGAIKFFENMDEIKAYIRSNKEYKEEPNIEFFGSDYKEELPITKVDMIISQYAGFVGQITKRYLKKGGILLCNDSHGDATLAYADDDYELIGIIDQRNHIRTSELDQFFKFTRPRDIDINKVFSTMKGPKYKQKPSNYLFRLR